MVPIFCSICGYLVVFYWANSYSFLQKALFILIFSTIDILTFKQVIFNEKRIVILYPFFKLIKPKHIDWGEILKIILCFRSGLTHGPMLPSYLEIQRYEQKSIKVYFHPTKEELDLLIDIVESANKKIVIKNNPYLPC